MILKSNIQLMFAFSNVTTDMNAVVTYTNHWGTARTVTIDGADFTVNGSYHVVTVDTLAVADARQDVTCTIYDGDTVVSTATDSVESYAARRSTGGDLFEYLMKFADSAYAYFHANESTATYSARGGQVDESENTGWVDFSATETTEESATGYSLRTASEEVCPANRELTSSTTKVYEYIYASGKLIRETIDDTSTEGTDVVMDFFYDANGNPYAMEHNGYMLYYILNPQGDVQYLVDSSGSPYVTYTYDEWGNPLLISNDSAVGKNNPLRYRGYVYDSELGMYYLQSRYYDPVVGRFINADSYASTGQGFVGYNMFAYCNNNPVNASDPNGDWSKWITGTLNVIGGGLQVAAGAALGATVGWTGVGAVAAGFLIVNGAATTTQGIGQIVNDITSSNVMYEKNIIRTGVQYAGRALGGDAGAIIAGGAYDLATAVAGLYAGKVGLQRAGLAPIKVNINSVVNNPLDEFVTIGPADGVINQYCRTIPQSGYGQIYVTQLENGLYQIANGHHRVEALRILGYETIKVYLTQ